MGVEVLIDPFIELDNEAGGGAYQVWPGLHLYPLASCSDHS
jgi:hypothetical protein